MIQQTFYCVFAIKVRIKGHSGAQTVSHFGHHEGDAERSDLVFDGNGLQRHTGKIHRLVFHA